MSETVIHLDGALPLAVLDERGWVQGAWESAGGVCAHQAIRLCAPVPGDAHLIEWVAKAHGHGPDWNDDDATLEADVRAWLAEGIDVTDDDLAEVFGPQWRAVVSLVDAAGGAAGGAARGAAGDAAGGAAGGAARGAAWDAAWAVVTWDLATGDGPYTEARRDLLIGPWVEVCGLPEGLIEREDMD